MQVPYRKKHYMRDKLMMMRKALVDKSEEVITNCPFVNSGQVLNPEKIFCDLIEFYSDNNFRLARPTPQMTTPALKPRYSADPTQKKPAYAPVPQVGKIKVLSQSAL